MPRISKITEIANRDIGCDELLGRQAEEADVNPCDLPRCKDARIAYETALEALDDAIGAVLNARQRRNAQGSVAAGLGVVGAGLFYAGATLVGAAATVATGGTFLLVLGFAAAAGGAASIGFATGAGNAARRAGNAAARASQRCSVARATYVNAKLDLIVACNIDCLPDFPSKPCP